MKWSVVLTVGVGVAVPLLVGSCSRHAAQLAKEPGIEVLDKLEGARCSLANDHPLLVEWPAGKRASLESALRRGTVLVAYAGCSLEVLDRCKLVQPAGNYSYVATNPKHEQHTYRTSDDLYAELPLSAASLEGRLRQSGRLTLDIQLVGRYEARQRHLSADQLEGKDCERATHFVRAVSVGAFRLSSGAEAEESGGVHVRAVGGVRSRGKASRGFVSEEGDLEACRAATRRDEQPPDRCAGLLRLYLEPVAPAETESVFRKNVVCPEDMIRLPSGACMMRVPGDGGLVEPIMQAKFIVKDETVFDVRTGLTWQRKPAPRRMGWEQAKAYCRNLVIGEDDDWRLPKPKELATLVDRTQGPPTIDSDRFPETPARPFWTFREDRSSPGDAVAIDFAQGKVVSKGIGKKLAVRCVR